MSDQPRLRKSSKEARTVYAAANPPPIVISTPLSPPEATIKHTYYPCTGQESDQRLCSAINDQLLAYISELQDYSASIFVVYETTSHSGKRMWHVLENAFRAHTIMPCSRPMLTQYIELIVNRSVYIDKDPGRNRHEAVIEMLNLEVYIQSKPTQEPQHHPHSHQTPAAPTQTIHDCRPSALASSNHPRDGHRHDNEDCERQSRRTTLICFRHQMATRTPIIAQVEKNSLIMILTNRMSNGILGIAVMSSGDQNAES